MGRMFSSLFVCPQHNSKTNDLKCSLFKEMTFGYPRNNVLVLKGQRSRLRG